MDLVTYGTILKNRIKECGYTQEDFAYKAGVGMSTLRKQINGTVAYRCDDLVKYAELLDCSYDFLLGYTNSPQRENADIVDKTGLSVEAINNLVAVQEMKNLNYISDEAKAKSIEIIETLQELINIIICDENFLSDMLLYIGSCKPLQEQSDENMKYLTKGNAIAKGIVETNMERINLASLMGDIEKIKILLRPELLDKMREDIKKVHKNIKAIPTQTVVKANE